MIAFPFIYFLMLGVFFYSRTKSWGLDMAAVSLLVAISFFAILIDVNNSYGNYGVNAKSYNILTLLLFCFQWTVALLPIHVMAKLPIRDIHDIKKPMLYILCILMFAFSLLTIYNSMDDIRDAMIMDVADVSNQHYVDLNAGESRGSNYLMLIPQIFSSIPFPTIAIVFWFFLNSFIDGKQLVKIGILISSLVQAVLSIAIAGRAAMIFWIFDFYLLFSFFHLNLSKKIKRVISLVSLVVVTLFGILFIAITMARFDGGTEKRDPFESFYAYAGQQVNNFSIMMIEGGGTPLMLDREFPFFARYVLNKKYDINDHYNEIVKYAKVQSNVFDTFGGEVYLDLGFFGYIMLMVLLLFLSWYIHTYWEELTFDRVLMCGVYVAFFTHGLFSWPFVGHYTSMALMALFLLRYLFKYNIKL